MNNYVVFIKDDESRVVIEKQLTRELSKELKSKGFTKYPHVIEASDTKDAIEKLNKKGDEHLNSLSQFSGSIFFYCAVIVAVLVLTLIFS